MSEYQPLRQPARRIGRRQALRGGVTLATGTAGAFLLACSGSNNHKAGTAATRAATSAGGAASPASGTPGAVASVTSASAEGTPKKGGTYIIDGGSASTEPPDPHTSLFRSNAYWSFIGDKLIEQDQQTIEPLRGALVESWETPDAATVILHPRQGVTWHEGKVTNGRAFNANDIAFNLQRIAGLLNPDRKGQFQRAATLTGLSKADVVDEKTAKVTLSSPNAFFLNGISDWRNWAVPPELVQADPNFSNYTGLCGTGAFIWDTYDQLTGEAHFKANPKYWRQGKPYFDAAQVLAFTDTASNIAAFIGGKLSISSGLGIVASRRKTILQQKTDTKQYVYPGISWYYLRFNQNVAPLGDQRVRQAMFLALDYKGLNDGVIEPNYWNYSGPLPAGFPGTWTADQVAQQPGWNPATKQQDLANAKQMMTAAGFANGKGVNLEIYTLPLTGSTGYAPIVQDQWSKAFPEAKLTIREAKDNGEFAATLGKADYQIVNYISSPPPSPILEASLHYHTGGSRNYTKWTDPTVDSLIDKAYTQADATARNQTIDQLQQKLRDLMWIIPMNQQKAVMLTLPNVRGVQTFNPGYGTVSNFDAAILCADFWFA
ncbi:MAG TPA: ABC transporter substrate-binding protein [Dehalococcoidia bacterium]|nr:ABC transporter substrate-binding protein [Dehalococcoidia bacterium]